MQENERLLAQDDKDGVHQLEQLRDRKDDAPEACGVVGIGCFRGLADRVPKGKASTRGQEVEELGAHAHGARNADNRQGKVPEAERGLEVKGLAVTHHFRAIVAKGEIERRGQEGDPGVLIEEEKGGGGVKMLFVGRVKRRQGRDELPNGVEGHAPGRGEGRRECGGVEGGKRGEKLVRSSRRHAVVYCWGLHGMCLADVCAVICGGRRKVGRDVW